MTLNCFEYVMSYYKKRISKIEFQKIANFLDTTFDDKDLPRFITNKGLKFMFSQKKNYNGNKEIRIKKPMLRSDLCDFSDAYAVVKGKNYFH